MREVLGRPQLDHPGNAFERVEMTEELIEHGPGSDSPDRGFKVEQQPADARQMLVALGEIIIEEGRQAAIVWRGGFHLQA